MDDALSTRLAVLRRASAPAGAEYRVAILGIGNDLNADDAAGVLVARGLRARQLSIAREGNGETRGDAAAPAGAPEAGGPAEPVPTEPVSTGPETTGPATTTWQAYDTGPSPESFTGPLRRFAPHLVVMVDAAHLGEKPGSVGIFDWPEAEGLSASTHTMPPSMLARFLTAELGCRVALVGIQPASLEFGEAPSAPVLDAVERVQRAILHSLLGEDPLSPDAGASAPESTGTE